MSCVMAVEIDHLTLDELVALNERVIERIKYLERIHVVEAMQTLNVGTRVTFDSSHGATKTGAIAKFNQKSVTVLTDEGQQWKVPPNILAPINGAES